MKPSGCETLRSLQNSFLKTCFQPGWKTQVSFIWACHRCKYVIAFPPAFGDPLFIIVSVGFLGGIFVIQHRNTVVSSSEHIAYLVWQTGGNS